MKTMAAGQFKARRLQVMETVRTTRVPVLITKRGKPVAELAPQMKHQLTSGAPAGDEILGDIAPCVPPEDWESW
jgi:prevent-host-death family protein